MKKRFTPFLKILYANIVLLMAALIMTSCSEPLLQFIFGKDRTEITETHDVKDFFNGTYLEYNGGKDAEVFFNEYAHIDDYKDIAFHYKDGEKGSYLNNAYYQHTVFALDVYYERDEFLRVSDEILLELTGQTAEEIFELYDGGQMVAFSGYKIEREDSVYKENNAAVLFDPQYNTIRYAFLCNNTGNVYEVKDATKYVLNVSNNYNGSWVFDYSDIAF